MDVKGIYIICSLPQNAFGVVHNRIVHKLYIITRKPTARCAVG